MGVQATHGKILWRYPWKTQEAKNAANPTRIGEDGILVTSTDNGSALLRGSGAIANCAATSVLLLFIKDWIFAKDDSQQLVCLEVASGAEKWRQPKFGTRWYDSGALLFGDKILVTNGRTGDLFLLAASGDRYRQLATLPSPAGPENLPAPVLS